MNKSNNNNEKSTACLTDHKSFRIMSERVKALKYFRRVRAIENMIAVSFPSTLSPSVHQLMVFECDDEMLLNFVRFNCWNLIFV